MPRIVSLGAALSAVLAGVGLSEFENPLERILPWFALVPLFLALYANREHVGRRWLDGLSFGWILCAWALHPLVQADLADAGGKDAGFLSLAGILARNGGIWLTISLLLGIFAAASGCFFRSRLRVLAVAGLALLWCGLEQIRTSFLPMTVPWIEIGESLDPGSPESQLASTIGVSGLGFVLVFVNLAFATVIFDRFLLRQVLLALLACGVVVLASLRGGLGADRPEAPDERQLRLGIVQIESADSGDILDFAGKILGSGPQVVVFPELAFLADAERLPIVQSRIEAFAKREGLAVIAGLGLVGAARPDAAPASGASDPDRESDEPHGSRSRGTPKASAIVYVTKDAGLLARLGDLPGPDLGDAQRDRAAAVLDTPLARLGVVSGNELNSSDMARHLADQGADLLLILDRDNFRAGDDYAAIRARMLAFRSIETGLPAGRATLGGVSGTVDGLGRPRNRSPDGSRWANASPLPLPDANAGPTDYVAWGWRFGPIAGGWAVGLIVALLGRAASLRHEARSGHPQRAAGPSASADD